jgi:hypothetical protein
MRSKPKSVEQAFPGASALISLVPLLTPQKPTFPRFSELIGEPVKADSPKKNGLFSALLGNPAVLLHDCLDSPAKYQDDVLPLVQDLVSGNKKIDDLTAEEMLLLDQATIDYNQTKAPPAPPQPPSEGTVKTAEADLMYDDSAAADQPAALADAPAYWWLDGDSP